MSLESVRDLTTICLRGHTSSGKRKKSSFRWHFSFFSRSSPLEHRLWDCPFFFNHSDSGFLDFTFFFSRSRSHYCHNFLVYSFFH